MYKNIIKGNIHFLKLWNKLSIVALWAILLYVPVALTHEKTKLGSCLVISIAYAFQNFLK